jgi:hypothetical protein
VGRDISFIIDGVAESEITQDERDAWKAYGAIHARQAGLSDERTPAASPF